MTAQERASPASERGERRRAKTRAAIIAAAEELLARTAPDAVRIEDVATRAGVSPATVYVHFGTKDGLVAATTEHLLDVTRAGLAAAYRDEGCAVDRVIATGKIYLQVLLDHPALTRYLTARALRTDEADSPAEIRIDDQIESLRRAFEELIQQAIDEGDLHSVDALLMSHFLSGAWVGVAALSLAGNSHPLSSRDVSRAGLQALQILTRGASIPNGSGALNARR